MSLYLTHRRLKLPKSAGKTQVKLTVDIKPRPGSQAQKQAWKRFWQKLLEVRPNAER